MTYASELALGYGSGRMTEQVTIWTGGTRRTGTVPLVLCHGFADGADQWYDAVLGTNVIARTIASFDVVCLGADLDGASTWGRDGFIDAIDDVIAWAGTNYGTRTDLVGIYGVSMGGLALNWIASNTSRLAAAALALPVCQLEAMHDRDPGPGFGAVIEAAYGGASGYIAALATVPSHDPIRNATTLATVADRVRLWYSSNDTTVVPSEVTGFADVTGIDAINVGAVGHTLAWDQQQVFDWLLPLLWWA